MAKRVTRKTTSEVKKSPTKKAPPKKSPTKTTPPKKRPTKTTTPKAPSTTSQSSTGVKKTVTKKPTSKSTVVAKTTTTKKRSKTDNTSKHEYIIVSEKARSNKYAELGEKIQKGEIQWAYYAIDGETGYHYYKKLK